MKDLAKITSLWRMQRVIGVVVLCFIVLIIIPSIFWIDTSESSGGYGKEVKSIGQHRDFYEKPVLRLIGSKSREKLKWYEGGNLHNTTVKRWRKATHRNRLATSSDFIAKAASADISIFSTEDLLENDLRLLKVYSVDLEKCITEATKSPNTWKSKISDVGGLCFTLLGYSS